MKKPTEKELGCLRFFVELGVAHARYYWPDGRHKRGIAVVKKLLKRLEDDG